VTNNVNDFSDDEIKARELTRSLWVLPAAAIVIAGALVLVYLIWFGLVQGAPLATATGPWGEFGDFLGGVLNPIIAFMSLMAILATVSLQVRELRLSSRELRNSSQALTTQTDILRAQAFDSLFFQLLRLHNEIVRDMDLVDPNTRAVTTKARDCFRIFARRLAGDVGQADPSFQNVDKAVEAYEAFYSNHYRELGHYYRLLYHLVLLVDRATFDRDQKLVYMNLIRAQLSSSEQVLLFFNCLSRWGREKFKPLVEKYHLFKTLPTVQTEQWLSATYRKAYADSAYGKEKALQEKGGDARVQS
jgi:hypothetical protein